jgi:hypothetical protein
MSTPEIDNLQKKIEFLETQVKNVIDSSNRELNIIRTMFFQQAGRFEALLRFLITKDNLSLDQFLFALEEYQKFKDKLVSLLKDKPAVLDRVKETAEYNKNAYFKLYADDINVLPQIEEAGGTSPATAKNILDSLPTTPRFSKSLQKYLIQIVPSEPSKDIFGEKN